MGFIGAIFNTLLYRPLLNILIFFYEFLPGKDFGVAIVVLTVLVRLFLYPLSKRAIQSQKALAEIQPQIKESQEKYKNDKEKQVKEMMRLYKEAKINPFSSLLPVLIQFPLLIALYRVFWQGLHAGQIDLLYSFMPRPTQINPTLFNFINLSQSNYILAIVAGILQFIQTKMVPLQPSNNQKKNTDFSVAMQKQMLYFFPILTVLLLLKLPAAVGLYWVTTILFSISQQYIIFKKPVK